MILGAHQTVTALKQVQDVGMITARHVFQKNMTFQSSHSLLTTTNYVPVVSETDHGTWRRLSLLIFPYTFRKPGEALESASDRRGDPTLKARIKQSADGQHDAIVTWAVEGAVRWHKNPETSLQPTAKIKKDTRDWQGEADRILGFWNERLKADRDSCILTTEMFDEFNSWLRSNGHNEWPRETFRPRFEQHAETTQHGVEVRRLRHPRGLSRRFPSTLSTPPSQARVYQGARFKTASDLGEYEGETGVPTP